MNGVQLGHRVGFERLAGRTRLLRWGRGTILGRGLDVVTRLGRQRNNAA